jgi:outer membrane cobalamin receptor
MKSFEKYLKFILLIIIIWSANTFAQINNSELLELSIEELLNVEVISSNKTVEKIIETPAFVNVISEEEIEMLDFTDLQNVLEYITGISSVNGEGNVFNTTTIRGNTLVNYNTNTLLLVDGIPIYSPYSGSFELSAIPLSSIKRIEIVKGSNSVLYGTNAVNATINIVTKDTPNYRENKSQSKILLGSNNTIYGNGTYLGRTDDFEYASFVDYYTTEGELLTIKDEKGNVLDFAQNKKSISFIGKVKYRDLFQFHFQTFNRNIPNFRTRGFQYIETSDESVNFIPHRNDEFGLIIDGKINYSFSSSQSIHFRSEYFDWKLNRDNLYGTWNYSSKLFSNDLEYKFKLNSISSNILGASFNVLNARRFKSEINDYDVGKDNEPTFDFALFLNGSVKIYDKFNLFYGGRYYSSKYKDVVLSDFSKRIALTYGFSKSLFMKINYGESFRVPTYFEKEVNSLKMVGNPTLQPEKSKSIDLIFSHIFNKTKLDFDFFFTEIKDKITRIVYLPDSTKKINQNIGTVEFIGLEVDSKFYFGNNIWGFAGFSYTIGRDEKTEIALPFTYNTMVNLGIEVKLLPALRLTNSLKYLDNWGAASEYFVLNSGLKIIPWNKSKMKIIVKVDNIFNTKIDLPEIARNNEEVPTIPKTYEREIFVGVSYDL